jgi:hypothetical protein
VVTGRRRITMFQSRPSVGPRQLIDARRRPTLLRLAGHDSGLRSSWS